MFVEHSHAEFCTDRQGQIQELKSAMASEKLWSASSDEEEDDEVDVDVFLGVHHSNLKEILSILPPRAVVDRTISVYFSARWIVLR
jgi:hypothetical protein